MDRGGHARAWNLWIDETPRPGWANMAIDRTLLDQAELGECWVRLYSWEPHCLSFGRHEPALLRYDRGRIRALGIDAVRRPTGGRAVWHSRELTYAVASPCGYFGSLAEAYLEIHQTLAEVLMELGVEASLAPRTLTPGLYEGACFKRPAGGEVMSAERKVIGSAQLRHGTAFLQHGSILLQDEQSLVSQLAIGAAAAGLLPQQASGFPALLDRENAKAELIGAISSGVRARWAGDWRLTHDAPEVLRSASDLYPAFRSPAWTWKR
jgi:lipoyl(octanoyl) transferase